METAPSFELQPASAPSGVAAIAAKAAAAAQAVVAANAKAAGSSAAAMPDAPFLQPFKNGVADDVLRQSHMHRPLPLGASSGAGSTAPQMRPPEMFSMDADDDSAYDCSSPSAASRLLEAASPSPDGLAPGLSYDEEREYEAIEARFQKFREHQTEVEANVNALLTRLNTQIRVPSSAASSECGDFTSRASSEWDTESLGPTEDGLSILDSPIETPRESTLLQKAASSSLPGNLNPELLSAAEKFQQANRHRPSHSPPASARGPAASARGKRLSFGSSSAGAGAGAGAGAAERGDFAGARASPIQDGFPHMPTIKMTDMLQQDEQPRLTPQLLEQSGLHEAERPSCLPEQAAAPRSRSVSPPPESPRPAPSRRDTAAPAMAAGAPPPAAAPTTAAPAAAMASPTMAAGHSPMVAAHSPMVPLELTSMGALELTAPLTPSRSAGDGTGVEDEELIRWQGWTVVATPEGRLFFHNEQANLSQWSQPPELVDVLGEWIEIHDKSSPETPHFWRNDLLCVSLWKDPRQTTNIFQAALDGNLFFLQLYAEVDGHLDVVDPKGRGALHYACAGGATQSAIFLLQRQAPVNRQDETGSTPLIFACRYGYASIVKLLLDAQASLDTGNSRGNTALHEAASMGQLDCCHLLLLCGAAATPRNADGDSPADIAATKKHYQCLTLLRRHLSVAPVNHASRGGDIPPLPGAQRAPVPGGMSTPPMQPSHSPMIQSSTVLEVPSRSATSESDPFAGTSSSSAGGVHSGGYDLASAVAAYQGQAVAPVGATHVSDGAHPAPTRSSGLRRRGRRTAGRPPQVQYVGQDSDSELEEVAEAMGHDHIADSDSGGASESSEDSRNRRKSSHSKRGRRRERSPVALGLLSRMQFPPDWLVNIRREKLAFAFVPLLFLWLLLGLKWLLILIVVVSISAFIICSTDKGRSLQKSFSREFIRFLKALDQPEAER